MKIGSKTSMVQNMVFIFLNSNPVEQAAAMKAVNFEADEALTASDLCQYEIDKHFFRYVRAKRLQSVLYNHLYKSAKNLA